MYIYKKFILIFIFLFINFNTYAQNNGLKDIVKAQQEKLTSVEKTLKKLIGKIEKNNSDTDKSKALFNQIKSLNDNLKILDTKIQTLNQFAYKLEFEIKRLQTHLNLSSSIVNNNKKESLNPAKSNLTKDKSKIGKESLDSKSNGVLGFIKEKEKEKKVGIRNKNIKKNNSFFPNSNPEEQYKFSLNYALKGDYDKAEVAFKEFIKINKNHKRKQDAQYWLGRVYFTKKRYEEAAIALAEYNSLYPDDKRFQETTLLIAESAANFAPKDQLCAILNQSLDFMTNPTENFTKKIIKLKKVNKCFGE